MKKAVLFMSLIMLVLAFAGCNKLKNDQLTPQKASQGVSFAIAPGQTGGVKSSSVTTDCFSTTANYAKITIDNIQYTRAIFYVSGAPYTNTIQLNPGLHSIQEFTIYSDNQTPNDSTDDVLLSAVPHANSAYSPYVASPLSITCNVEVFKKTQLPIEAVC